MSRRRSVARHALRRAGDQVVVLDGCLLEVAKTASSWLLLRTIASLCLSARSFRGRLFPVCPRLVWCVPSSAVFMTADCSWFSGCSFVILQGVFLPFTSSVWMSNEEYRILFCLAVRTWNSSILSCIRLRQSRVPCLGRLKAYTIIWFLRGDSIRSCFCHEVPGSILWSPAWARTSSSPSSLKAVLFYVSIGETQALSDRTEIFLEGIVVAKSDDVRFISEFPDVVNHGKTKVWNRAGVKQAGCDELTAAARLVKDEARVWTGDQGIPTNEQGMRVLGSPIGHPGLRAVILSTESNRTFHFFGTHPCRS